MSYNTNDARIEQTWEIEEALRTRDCMALFRLAALLKEQGDDEEASILKDTARRIEREDSMYDELNNN